MRLRYDEFIFVDRRGRFVCKRVSHGAVIEGGVERAPISYLRDRPNRVGILGHHATLLRASSAYRVAIEHTVDAFSAGRVGIEAANLLTFACLSHLDQAIFAQLLALRSALY